MASAYRWVVLVALLSACGGRALVDVAAGGAGAVSDAGAGGPATTDFGACDDKTGCVLTAVGPCGVGCEPIPISRLVAIASDKLDAYERSKPPTLCIAERACPDLEYAALQMQNYYARCVSGQCQALDVRTTELSVCQEHTDCTLRSGTSCCGCGNDHLIAVASTAPVEQAFCAPSGFCMADCVPRPLPPFVAAWCTAGHCGVHYPP